MAHQNPSEWECSICYNLLLDPVVGKCGHDFCKSCLQSWAQTCEAKGVQCPLCRTELADSLEGIKNLGVCVRLKRMLETLYPDRIAQRRLERQSEEARAAAQRDARQQHSRVGRTRYLRATRTRRSAATASTHSMENPSTLPPTHGTPPASVPDTQGHSPSSTPHTARNPYLNGQPAAFQLLPSSLRLRLLGTADLLQATTQLLHSTQSTHQANGDSEAGQDPNHVPPSSQHGARSDTWQAPATITFNMGWWEPSKESRRKRLASQRHRLAMLANAAASAAQQTYSLAY